MIATQSLTSTQPPRALIAKRYLPAALWLFYIPSCFQLYQPCLSGFFFLPVPGMWDSSWGGGERDWELGKREGITISLLPCLTLATCLGIFYEGGLKCSSIVRERQYLPSRYTVLYYVRIKTDALNTQHTKCLEQLRKTEGMLTATWLLTRGDRTN